MAQQQRAPDYPENKRRWRKGDLVLHRSDAKQPHMLMVVLGYDQETGECKTRYLDPMNKPYLDKRKVWRCDLDALLDPADFNIRVEDWRELLFRKS